MKKGGGLVIDGHLPPIQRRVQAGTPGYMAPEVMRGESASWASDWYSLGAMLHKTLFGELPLQGNDLAKRPSAGTDAPVDLLALCTGLLHPEQKARFDGRAIRATLQGAERRVAAESPSMEEKRAPPFVGRSAELAQLKTALAQVERGHTVVLRIHGPPGIGKSALVNEFLRWVELSAGCSVLRGRCHEHEFTQYRFLDQVADDLGTQLATVLLPEPPRAQQAPWLALSGH